MKIFVLALITAAVLAGVSVAHATPKDDDDCTKDVKKRHIKTTPAIDCSKDENKDKPACKPVPQGDPTGTDVHP